jgi:hypothetical protein
MTTHADEEADERYPEHSGYRKCGFHWAQQRRRDRQTREWKYVLSGQTLDGPNAAVVAKFGLVGRLYILTVYEERTQRSDGAMRELWP